MGGLIEFDSKNDFVLDLDPGHGRVALLRGATDVVSGRSGVQLQPVPR